MLRDFIGSVILLVAIILLSGCKDTPVSQNADQLQPFYSTSFEVPADTVGWHLIAATITSEGSPYGGARSLLQHGGDVTVGSYKVLPPVGVDSVYFIQFYGRLLKPSGRGVVVLAPMLRGLLPVLRVDFRDTTWGYYTVTGSFPPGTEIALDIACLGIGNSALVDDIHVYTVKE